jgi:hypothetical protein
MLIKMWKNKTKGFGINILLAVWKIDGAGQERKQEDNLGWQ